jgi:phosphofructokinase-like protein
MRIGLLTGGGDCPGLNAVIRAAVLAGTAAGNDFIGFRDGWRGPLDGLTMAVGPAEVRDILERGGTILGSSRTNPLKIEGGVEQIRATLLEHNVDALIAIGGEDTLGVATKLHELGVPVVGVPKTIDNDLSATDYTFGFDTSVNIAMEAIDRLHTTADSHHRVLVVEVMGRHAGWIALHAGMAGSAAAVLIPEQDFDLEEVAGWVRSRAKQGRAPIVVVAEGAQAIGGGLVTKDETLDAFGHVRLAGVADRLAAELERRTGIESRSVVLGHLQRGGTPTAFDRVLGTRFGAAAFRAVEEREFGCMVALRGTDIVRVPLAAATGVLKTVPAERYAEARAFFG